MDATLDFLSENARRRYPLDADCLVSVIGGGWPAGLDGWPDGIVLDARGFWRGAGGATFYLSAFCGSSSVPPSGLSVSSGASTLFFGRDLSGATYDFRFDVPDALSPADFPVTLRATVADPDPDYAAAGVLLGALEVTIGADLRLLLPPAWSGVFGASAPLEPACVFDLGGGQQVDRLQGIRVLLPNFSVGGAASLVSGYNVDVRTRADGVVEVAARVGAGVAGTYVGESPSPCGSVLRTLNGIGPDSRGRFFLRAGSGVAIENFPDLHRIDVTLATTALGADACAPPTTP